MGEYRMNCRCKGLCKTLKYRDTYDIRMGRNAYRLGYRRCSECEYYIMNKIKCPCCGDYLRRKPRNNRSRRLYNEVMGI